MSTSSRFDSLASLKISVIFAECYHININKYKIIVPFPVFTSLGSAAVNTMQAVNTEKCRRGGVLEDGQQGLQVQGKPVNCG